MLTNLRETLRLAENFELIDFKDSKLITRKFLMTIIFQMKIVGVAGKLLI
jgi:hypothetical protein